MATSPSARQSPTLLQDHRSLIDAIARKRLARGGLRSDPTPASIGPPCDGSWTTDRVLPTKPLRFGVPAHLPPRPVQSSSSFARNSGELSPFKRAKHLAYDPNYVHEEETIRNDVPARYAAAGEWGANYIYASGEDERFEE